MEINENSSVCNKKLDKDNYKKNGTICKNWWNEKRRKNKNIHILIQNQHAKNDNVNSKSNNQTFWLVDK